MKKRFTDTDKWDDPWFAELPAKFKCFWIFILDKCDNAGVWKVNWKSAENHIGGEFNEKNTLPHFEDRILILDKLRWFIKKFIKFQYGKLSDKCKPHIQVLELLEEHNITLSDIPKGYTKGIHTLQEKEEDKDKDKDQEKEEEKKRKNSLIKNVVAYFCKKHKEKKGFSGNYNAMKHQPIILSWLKTYDLEQIYCLIDDFFRRPDDWHEQVVKWGHTFPAMNATISLLSINKPATPKIVTESNEFVELTPEKLQENKDRLLDMTKGIGK